MSPLPPSPLLPFVDHGGSGPLLVFLHWLGGTAQSWSRVAAGLKSRGYRCVALDLPGFGRARDDARYSVEAMRDAAAATIASLLAAPTERSPAGDRGDRDWGIVGHSMGAKVASAIARQAADGDAHLGALRLLITVSGSPPSPEPMDEASRARLLRELGTASLHPPNSAAQDRAYAEKFLRANIGAPPLAPGDFAEAAGRILTMNRAAWTAWLTTGSKDDWRDRIGRLPQPALVMYGDAEEWLGSKAQMNFVDRHAPEAELSALEGAAHLGPLERAAEVVDRIAVFAAARGLAPKLSSDFADLIASPRTSEATRKALEARIAVAPAPTSAWSEAELRALRALVARIVPGAPLDIATRVHNALAEGVGDGWRFDAEPADAAAWHAGLARLDAAARAAETPGTADERTFAAATAEEQDAVISADSSRWMEDAKALIVQTYMSDPRTMERVGFRGFADEGGFTQIRLGQRESFER